VSRGGKALCLALKTCLGPNAAPFLIPGPKDL